MSSSSNTGINLSYVIPTYNKLPFLKKTLNVLINSAKKDEEIIVMDGGSNDGTKEYLQTLFNEEKIQKYISEPDKGESHAANKGFLMASGELIRYMTDDDAFHFPSIEKCKLFLLQNKHIDVLGTE